MPSREARKRLVCISLFTVFLFCVLLVQFFKIQIVEGDKWTTHVEVAWNPEWVGTAQVRSFTLNGKYLEVLTPWRIMPNWADKGMTRSIITFERAQ